MYMFVICVVLNVCDVYVCVVLNVCDVYVCVVLNVCDVYVCVVSNVCDVYVCVVFSFQFNLIYCKFSRIAVLLAEFPCQAAAL